MRIVGPSECDGDRRPPGCGGQPAARALTVCQDKPNSAVMAEMVVRSIINRRNTYRAHRRVVEDRGAASLPRSWLKDNPPALSCEAAVAGHGDPRHQGIAGDR
jgi:hypothetical protein